MSKYSMEIVVNCPVKTAYDTVMSYFTNAGYGMVNHAEPSLIELTRPGERHSILLPSDELRREHNLTVNLYGYNGATKVVLNFVCPSSIVPYSRGAKDKIEVMLHDFISYAPSFVKENESKQNNEAPSQVIREEKIIERQIVKVRCRYCGSLNNDGSRCCESCGAVL